MKNLRRQNPVTVWVLRLPQMAPVFGWIPPFPSWTRKREEAPWGVPGGPVGGRGWGRMKIFSSPPWPNGEPSAPPFSGPRKGWRRERQYF